MIEVYNTPVDLGMIIFGESEDKDRDYFEKTLSKVKMLNIEVKEYNTAEHFEVCEDKTLPYIVINGTIYEGRYPSVEMMAKDLDIDVESIRVPNTLLKEANTCRLGSCCGVGSDIYLDPNEEL